MRKEHVVMVPDFREGNPYQSLLANHLSDQDVQVSFDKLPLGYFPFSELSKQHPDATIIHLHWLSPILFVLSWTSSPFKAKLRGLLLALDCLWLRLRGKKIVWTVHNKFSHENFDRTVELFVRRLLVKSVSNIIVHSQSAADRLAEAYEMPAIKDKAKVIFHGNYEGIYPRPASDRDALLKTKNIPPEHTVILSFGMLRPYKGIDKLAELFASGKVPDHIHLLIMGKADNEDYAASLQTVCDKADNVHLTLGFLTDEALADWLGAADMVAVPFSDTLTSGSVLLAMTEGKALLLPELSKVFDCVPDEGALFYTDEDDMVRQLAGLSASDVAKMGEANKAVAHKMNWPDVARLTAELYQR